MCAAHSLKAPRHGSLLTRQKVSDIFVPGGPEGTKWEFKHRAASFRRGDLAGLRDIKQKASRRSLMQREYNLKTPSALWSTTTPPEFMPPTPGAVDPRIVSLEHRLDELNDRLQRHGVWDGHYRSKDLETQKATATTAETSREEEDLQYGSDSDSISRTPSPWQVVDGPEVQLALVRSLWWVRSRLEYESQSSQNTSDVSESPGDETGSDNSNSRDGRGGDASDGAGGSGDGSSRNNDTNNPSIGPGLDASTTPGSQQTRKRLRGSDDPDSGRGGDDEDAPGGKRWQIQAPDTALTRPRLACPYQKYDPMGSPFCCMPNQKNREGGADTFPRIKYGLFFFLSLMLNKVTPSS